MKKIASVEIAQVILQTCRKRTVRRSCLSFFLWRTDWKLIHRSCCPTWFYVRKYRILKIFIDRDRGLDFFSTIHNGDLVVFVVEMSLIYPLLYINFGNSYAWSQRLYVLGFFNVCCNVGHPSFCFINASHSWFCTMHNLRRMQYLPLKYV